MQLELFGRIYILILVLIPFPRSQRQRNRAKKLQTEATEVLFSSRHLLHNNILYTCSLRRKVFLLKEKLFFLFLCFPSSSSLEKKELFLTIYSDNKLTDKCRILLNITASIILQLRHSCQNVITWRACVCVWQTSKMLLKIVCFVIPKLKLPTELLQWQQEHREDSTSQVQQDCHVVSHWDVLRASWRWSLEDTSEYLSKRLWSRRWRWLWRSEASNPKRIRRKGSSNY